MCGSRRPGRPRPGRRPTPARTDPWTGRGPACRSPRPSPRRLGSGCTAYPDRGADHPPPPPARGRRPRKEAAGRRSAPAPGGLRGTGGREAPGPPRARRGGARSPERDEDEPREERPGDAPERREGVEGADGRPRAARVPYAEPRGEGGDRAEEDVRGREERERGEQGEGARPLDSGPQGGGQTVPEQRRQAHARPRRKYQGGEETGIRPPVREPPSRPVAGAQARQDHAEEIGPDAQGGPRVRGEHARPGKLEAHHRRAADEHRQPARVASHRPQSPLPHPRSAPDSLPRRHPASKSRVNKLPAPGRAQRRSRQCGAQWRALIAGRVYGRWILRASRPHCACWAGACRFPPRVSCADAFPSCRICSAAVFRCAIMNISS